MDNILKLVFLKIVCISQELNLGLPLLNLIIERFNSCTTKLTEGNVIFNSKNIHEFRSKRITEAVL